MYLEDGKLKLALN